MIDFVFKCFVVALLLFMSFCLWRIGDKAKSLHKSILYLSSTISCQTSQQSWLVSHYMTPVRPLYNWEIHKCRWCGSEVKESDSPDEKLREEHDNFIQEDIQRRIDDEK